MKTKQFLDNGLKSCLQMFGNLYFARPVLNFFIDQLKYITVTKAKSMWLLHLETSLMVDLSVPNMRYVTEYVIKNK